MRFIIATAFAVALLMPTSGRSPGAMRASAGTPAASAPAIQTLVSDDMSAAKKKRLKQKAAKQEQYLRAVPSTPPAGAKQ
jgi:hypothetical protein